MTIGWSFIENFENDSQPYKHKTRDVSEQKRCTTNEKYVTNTNSCVPCESGTYQSADNHTLVNCKINDDLKLNGFNWPRGGQNWNISKIDNKMSIDECRQHVLDEKKKGNTEYDNVVVVGHRNSKHVNPPYKNTCWYIRNDNKSNNTTVNAIGYVDDVHQIVCVDSDGNPIECNTSKENCDGSPYHYYLGSENLCKETNTCPNGKELVNAGGKNPGNCQWCPGGKYKNSGQNRSSCSEQNTCPNGQQLVGVPRDDRGNLKTGSTSAGTCQWCPGGKYKNSGQNRKLCEDQHTCPNGKQLVGASNTSPGSCQWCPGGQYKNSGQNRSACSWQHTCPNGQQLVGVPRDNRGNLQIGSTSAGTCQWCPGGQYKNSGQNRSKCSDHTRCGYGYYLSGASNTSAGRCISHKTRYPINNSHEFYWGAQIGATDTRNVHSCAHRCEDTSGCKGFIHDPRNNHCLLFNNDQYRYSHKWTYFDGNYGYRKKEGWH